MLKARQRNIYAVMHEPLALFDVEGMDKAQILEALDYESVPDLEVCLQMECAVVDKPWWRDSSGSFAAVKSKPVPVVRFRAALTSRMLQNS